MNLFAKQEQRHRHREQMYGLQWGEGEGGMNWEIGIDTTMRTYCIAQGILLSVLW